MSSVPGPRLCLQCGWIPIDEIEAQLAYWNKRRESALARLDDEATPTTKGTSDVD
jgi:hypothetical protein